MVHYYMAHSICVNTIAGRQTVLVVASIRLDAEGVYAFSYTYTKLSVKVRPQLRL